MNKEIQNIAWNSGEMTAQAILDEIDYRTRDATRGIDWIELRKRVQEDGN